MHFEPKPFHLFPVLIQSSDSNNIMKEALKNIKKSDFPFIEKKFLFVSYYAVMQYLSLKKRILSFWVMFGMIELIFSVCIFYSTRSNY